MPKNRTKNSPRPVVEEPYIKDFLDMVAPSVIDFKVDHYLCGNTCRCVWALREYPTSTDEQAILLIGRGGVLPQGPHTAAGIASQVVVHLEVDDRGSDHVEETLDIRLLCHGPGHILFSVFGQ